MCLGSVEKELFSYVYGEEAVCLVSRNCVPSLFKGGAAGLLYT